MNYKPVLNAYLGTAIRIAFMEFFPYLATNGRQINHLEMQWYARQVCKRQHAFNEGTHLPGSGMNPVEIMPGFVIG